ncbi:unnamed protein product [Soboliphyme baturini]|uniref:PNPLA domain-containing protein n=1 Tax=Soboliphyme baturini TaxID=241478 RepID=A0A183JBC5_9BILA|nr:unnamed protein product [Soboliphyme baturini]
MLGALHPSVNLTNMLRKLLKKSLPTDAHKFANGKLFISLTRLSDGENVLVSEFVTRDELIEV